MVTLGSKICLKVTLKPSSRPISASPLPRSLGSRTPGDLALEGRLRGIVDPPDVDPTGKQPADDESAGEDGDPVRPVDDHGGEHEQPSERYRDQPLPAQVHQMVVA